MLTNPFHHARYIIDKIEEHGHQAYFVGGCVRDLLLNNDIKDIDIATSAKPELIQDIFDKVIPVGIEHGTVIVHHQGISYEVTTFRLDGSYSDERHPDSVQFIDRIDEDLARRDFTMNALAMDKHGKIIDLYGGKRDLQAHIIRTVGDGVKRFKEDPLRIIRALRFTSQLGFSIETDTLKAMKTLKAKIEHLAVERLYQEMERFFAGKYVDKGMYYLKDLNIHQYLPVFKSHPHIVYQFPQPVMPLNSFAEVITVLHLLEPEISVQSWVKGWKASNQIKRKANLLVDTILQYKKNGLDRWLVYQLPAQYDEAFLRIIHYILGDQIIDTNTIHLIREELAIHSKKELAVNGHDILKMFPNKKAGPWVQRLLNQIERLIVTEQLKNHKEKIKEWIKCNPPGIN
ncbi:tRNA nucleotidyltransferase (CCA-adding enzyme) [Cerasibacillus quisquiliarum]|uniref:CCA-adding enzyme n=1 Tax=Cerasibacillus quisquiliarum TaxID=227865 RepID=A0A511V212_9BACI|nr:CCA tRNA nucleotidyltransferase [Cerasibacillus quisquiliarum]MBB5145357.1 tRNA nucleotidyltransferase (CCA-adding enzyme) [Cerasibacillus quisquiliarum]GEN31793.1 CCA-adding enzyme [Cerasibacillus quisquiliarum]